MWGSYVCRQHCVGGGLGDGTIDYVGGGSSVCDEVEDEVQQKEEQDYGSWEEGSGTS